MIGKLPMKLLLLHLLVAVLVPSAADYRTVTPGVTIYSPIAKEIDTLTECECKTKCWLDSGCTAASYDAVADICSMTDGGPDTVTTRPLLDSVAFFKFNVTEAPLEVFLSAKTNNGTRANQMALCAAQNGMLLIIKTQQEKDEAMRVSQGSGGSKYFGCSEYESWISARHCNDELKLECRWPDGTSLFDAIFTVQDVSDATISPGPATLLQGSGNVVAVADSSGPLIYPVLCSRNLN